MSPMEAGRSVRGIATYGRLPPPRRRGGREPVRPAPLRALVADGGRVDGGLVAVPERVRLVGGGGETYGQRLVAVHRVEDGTALLRVGAEGLGVLHDVLPDHVHGLDDLFGDALGSPDAEVV